jgi:hypothetical protein
MNLLFDLILSKAYLGLLCAVYLFNTSEVFDHIKKFLLLTEDTKATKEWHFFLITLFNCPMCNGFWFGLIYYQDWLLASIFAVNSEILTILISKLGNTLKIK